MKTAYVEYRDGETVLEGYLAYDQKASSPRPAVLVAHDWSGRRDLACAGAERAAELGYVGFALDLFGKGVFGRTGDSEGNAALIRPFVEDRGLLRSRMQAALRAVREMDRVDADNVAAMGYCFGGMAVLELARAGADLKGVASVHGLLERGEVPSAPIRARVLCLHGHRDPMVPPGQVRAFEQEMTEGNADWQLHVYGRAMHAFTNPAANNPKAGAVYDEIANRRAEAALAAFFQELFA